MMQKKKEEYAIVLDYLVNGYPLDKTPSYKRTPIVQMLGRDNFTLLEAVPKKEAEVKHYDELYIGDGKRDKIHHINGKLDPHKMTPTAKTELENVVPALVAKNEERFVEFFNKAQPLSTRMHTLELINGLGKKHMWEIVNQREEAPFKSFDDLKNRIKLLPDPKKLIIKRIISELEGNEKYNLFVDR
jgi:putative nucleotide binding protein